MTHLHAFVRETELTERSAVPAFETIAVCVADEPTVTVPNASDAGETAMAGAVGVVEGTLFASPGSDRALISSRFVNRSPSESLGSARESAVAMPEPMLARRSLPYGLKVLVPPLPS